MNDLPSCSLADFLLQISPPSGQDLGWSFSARAQGLSQITVFSALHPTSCGTRKKYAAVRNPTQILLTGFHQKITLQRHPIITWDLSVVLACWTELFLLSVRVRAWKNWTNHVCLETWKPSDFCVPHKILITAGKKLVFTNVLGWTQNNEHMWLKKMRCKLKKRK